MTSKFSLSSVVCTILLFMVVVLPVSSWVMQALGMPVHNLLCGEGYRWLCLHSFELFAPSYILPIFALIISVGCIQSSGILLTLQRSHRTVNEKLGLIAASTISLVLFLGFMVPVFRVDSAMRSVTGQLFPSPWFNCAPYAISAIAFLAMLGYCVLARKERFHFLVGQLLSHGISCYGLWLVNISLFNLLMEMGRYVFTI